MENFSLLEKCRDDYLQNEHQKLEDYLYHTESDEIEHTLATLPAFYLECERDSEQEMVCVKCSDCLVMAKIPESVRSTEVTEIVGEEEDCDALMIIRGEDVVLSYEGESRVRHVEADFCMDQMPVLWKLFSRVSDEEDNWAKLSPQKARQLTDVLVDAIIKENVATLYLSLEPWGEGHNLVLEFMDGWVDITYMDDDTPVYYNYYNPAYADSSEILLMEYGGQSEVSIPKMFALDDKKLTAEIVRHFFATGQLLQGTLWKKGTEEAF